MWSVVTNHPEMTERLGGELGKILTPSAVVALVGNLGSGKTHLVRGIAAACGVDPALVTSPTFTLLHEYDGTRSLFHLDLYRLRDADEYWELGLDEIVDEGGILLIEWADRFEALLPADVLRLSFTTTGETVRAIQITANGEASGRLLQELRARWEALPSGGATE